MGEKSHKCYNGKVFADASRTKFIPCPVCQKERKEDARDGVLDEETGEKVSLAQKLGVNKRFVPDTYSDEYIIGKADMYYLDKETLSIFNEQVHKLVSNLIMGVLPSTSMIMYLGRHARLQEFAYILLASAHKGVRTVGKILTTRDIKLNKYNEDFQEHYTNDLSVVIATDDVDSIGLSEIQGFMQARAYNDRPTIVLLSNKRNFSLVVGRLCSLDSPRYDLGSFVGVSYKRQLTQEDSVLIARKAIEVTNEALGTKIRLEDHYVQEPKNQNEQKGVFSNDSGQGQMDSLDLEALTRANSFNGR